MQYGLLTLKIISLAFSLYTQMSCLVPPSDKIGTMMFFSAFYFVTASYNFKYIFNYIHCKHLSES